MKNIILFIVLLGVALVVTLNFESLHREYNARWRTYDVYEVISDPRYFDQLPYFTLTGAVEEGWGVPAMFKVFPLIDTSTGDRVLVIPKTKVLPRPTNIPAKFRVQIFAEPHLLGEDILILKEF